MFFQVWFSSSKGTTNGCKQGIYYSFRDTFPAPEKDSLLHVSRTFSFLLYSHGDNNGQEGGKKDRRRSAFQPQLRQFNNLRIIWSSMGFLCSPRLFFLNNFGQQFNMKGKRKKRIRMVYVWLQKRSLAGIICNCIKSMLYYCDSNLSVS